MTVRELYDYAISHSLIDHQVDDVLTIYNNKETYLNMSLDSEEVMKVNIILDWLNCRK